MIHFLVSHCGALTEAETYSGYTAYQVAFAAAPLLADILADLGANIRPCPQEKSSSSDEEESYNDARWRARNDQVMTFWIVLHFQYY